MTEQQQTSPVKGMGAPNLQSEENIFQTAMEYYRTFVRPYIWLYPVALVLFVAGAFLFLRTAVPRYRATAEVLVNSTEVRTLDVQGLQDPSQGGQASEFINTQIRVLNSDEILSRAYERLGEDSDLVSLPKIDRIPGLSILSVTVESENPELAARFANTVVDVYTEFTNTRKVTITKAGSSVLREQLKQVQANRDKAMADLLAFKQQHGIFDFNESYRTLVSQKSALSDRLFDAKMAADEIGATITEVAKDRERAIIMLPYLLPDGGGENVTRFEEMLLTHEMKKPELLTQYNESHIAIKVHNVVSDMIRKTMHQQLEVMLKGMKLRQERQLKRAEEYQKQIDAIETKLVELDKLGGDYRMHEAACTKLDETITMITNRLNELEIADATTLGNLSVRCVSVAKKPTEPFFPQPLKIIGGAAVGGLAFALLISVLLVLMNNKVTSAADVVRVLGAETPVFGSVPHFDKPEKELLKSDGEEPIDETFRDIRTSLNLSMFTRESRILAVSSAIAGEGKTFTIINLARSFARDHRRVLLMDLDLRCPRLHRALRDFFPNGVPDKGLSNVLVGDAKLEDVIIHLDALDLDVLLAGPLPPNPNELLGSQAFTQLLDEAKQRYDMTFIDTPPIMPVSDTLLIASHSVALLLVTRFCRLPKPVLVHLANRLAQLQLRVSGIIPNMADVPKSRYGSYGYGYGYGYGYSGHYGYGGRYGYRSHRAAADDGNAKS